MGKGIPRRRTAAARESQAAAPSDPAAGPRPIATAVQEALRRQGRRGAHPLADLVQRAVAMEARTRASPHRTAGEALHPAHAAYARRRKAHSAAAQAIGLDHIPARGEILVRLPAAAGEEDSVAALRAESRREPPSMEKPGAYEHLALPRHGPVLKARIKAVERECQRALKQGEPGTGGFMAVTPLEFSTFRCGALLWKFGTDPAKGRPGATPGWRLARPDAEAADDVPLPPLPGVKRPRGGPGQAVRVRPLPGTGNTAEGKALIPWRAAP